MCGFTGSISLENINSSQIENENKYVECRGPDEKIIKYGNFSEYNKNLNFNYSFIFNRLSILELSELGSQPMYSKTHNSLIMFNGEIYNHQELRKYLSSKGASFISKNSDTETLLHGLSIYGLDFLKKINGQFSIFFIDFNKSKAYIIRDRLGQKPMYYFFKNNSLSFSSNLTTLKNIIKNVSISERNVKRYINYGVISSPHTIYKDLYKVEPGQILEFNFLNKNIDLKKSQYWEIGNYKFNEKFVYEDFISIFENSVNLRKEADVDISAFLSGGIDSTSIIKSLNNSSDSVNTYFVGNNDKKYDESQWAEVVVNKYKTNHSKSNLSFYDFENLINEAIAILDEPYADPSLVPTYLICKEISKNYKVALTGDGGDELLAGYARVQQLTKSKKSNNYYSKLFDFYPWFLGTGNRLKSNSSNYVEAYTSYFSDKKLLEGLNIEDDFEFENAYSKYIDGNIKGYLAADYRFYLGENMLLKIDKSSMANSLEARSPFVDHRLVEYIMSTNLDFLINNPKSILKKYLIEDFSTNFLNRKKMGFMFNIESWIFENYNHIIEQIKQTDATNYFDPNKLGNLNKNKSRVNGQRIYKLYVLSKFL